VQSAGSDAQAAQSTGTVTGVVTDMATKLPVLRQGVMLRAADGAVQSALTDERGRFTFRDLPAGDYTLEWYPGVANRTSQQPLPLAKKPLVVTAGETAEANIAVLRPDIPVATPYGAPPARRRRV
jgi:hypothetical protein